MVDIYHYHLEKSKKIFSGAEYTLYLKTCKCCGYKTILSNPPCGPGGTLSCPVCSEKKENGPYLERSYGRIRVKSFKVILPKDLEDNL